MWKCTSRGIKSVFCKNQCSHNNVSTREARNDRTINCFLKLTPVLLGDFNRGYRRSNYGPSSKNEKQNPKTHKRCLDDFQQNLFNLFGWTGILAIGWAFNQPVPRRPAVLCDSEPRKICPFSVLNRVRNNEHWNLLQSHQSQNEFLSSGVSLIEVNSTRSSKSVDAQELQIDKSNLQELETAHQKVLGTLSNYLGAECMKKKNYSEAFIHFEEGAEMDNTSAIFNLGVCHEMGWGTNQDLKKAAEMYKKASDLGHPAATYNLGVFYVHGLGDLKSDMNKARKLFEIAASLGQPDAREALDLEGISGTNSNNNTKPVSCGNAAALEKTMNYSQSKENKVDITYMKSSKLGTMGYLYKVLSDEITQLGSKCFTFDDSGAQDLSPEIT